MNDRKLQVIKTAHQLFLEKGFQATSIQDILDRSRISKGTFYNYFSSKSELLTAIIKSLYKELEKKRNDLLIGQNRTDLDIFVKQVQFQWEAYKTNKLFTLFEEIFVSNDADLKQFIKRYQLIELRWMHQRLVDLFGDSKKPYLLDCAIILSGMLHHSLHYQHMANGTNADGNRVARYCVERLVRVVEEVAETGEQLLDPGLLEKWLPASPTYHDGIRSDLVHSTFALKNAIYEHVQDETKQQKYAELMDFLQEELFQVRHPRKFIIDSVLCSLKANPCPAWNKELQQFERLAASYLEQAEAPSKIT
jgi:AcrR family transcriptional regulator